MTLQEAPKPSAPTPQHTFEYLVTQLEHALRQLRAEHGVQSVLYTPDGGLEIERVVTTKTTRKF